MNDIIDIIIDFYYDHQRTIVASIIVLIGMIIGYTVFLVLYNPIKIKFTGEDYKVIATKTSDLNYKAIAYDKKTQDYPITWKVSGGILDETEGSGVIWSLPQNPGTYTITATSFNKSITKKVTVIENILTQSLETSNIASEDTDMDGLTDEYEENSSKTDPKKSDTDEDGLLDGDEILLGMNPLLIDTKGDSIKDSERELNYKFTDKNTNVVVNIVGKGNLTKTTVDKYSTVSLDEIKEVASPLYYVYTDAIIKSMNISLKYDKETIKKRGLKEDKLSIYMLDEETNKFTQLDSTLDIENKTINVNLEKNCKVFIADSSTMKTKLTTELVFVIDNSGSMYSAEQISGSSENDINFERINMSNKMIDKLKGDYKFGAGKFTFDYTNLVELTSDKELVKSKIESIKNNTEKFTGTYIAEALSGGVKQFSGENTNASRRYMILLTDGKDTEEVNGYNKGKIKTAIEEAQRKGVRVFTIGLGSEIDSGQLSDIANKTGGKYYYAPNADNLNDLFEMIAAQINYNFIDLDADHVDDNILVSDSGFITKRDGFPYDNIPLKKELNGTTYGMSLMSNLYYNKKMPSKLSEMSVKVPNSDKVIKSSGFNLNDLRLKGTLYENKIKKLEFLSEEPKNLRPVIEKGLLKYKLEYANTLRTIGVDIYSQPYNDGNAVFKSYENYIVDIDSMKAKEMDYEMTLYSMLNAFYRMDILKYRDETISFKDNSDKAMNYLLEKLNSGEPCLIKLNDTYTVNAIRVVEENKNPNKIKIEVYDTNVAGKTKYIECLRSKVSSFNIEDGISKEVNKKYIYSFTYYNKNVDVKISIPNISYNL